jgi:hypothetical protein
MESKADILFFGGAAGGGKSDLLLGLSGTEHSSSIIFRRSFKQLQGLRERAETLYLPFGTFNGQKEIWRLKVGEKRRRVEFGACQILGDEQAYQGRPHDLKGFDEITHFHESQFRFLMGWNRSDVKGQRSRVVATGNPPTNAEGYWVTAFWSAWLDPKHSNPAKDGELRWFAQIKDRKTGRMVDTEVDGPDLIHLPDEPYPIQPLSRTFIRARLTDNPVYMQSGYMSVLQAMPEPLRSQMLHGDFLVGHEDHPRQIIPTEWVLQAQARWRPKEDLDPRARMDSLGVDVARGGKDYTVMTARYGPWFDEQMTFPGTDTPDGFKVLELIANAIPPGEKPSVNIDVINIGASVYDLAKASGLRAFAMDARQSSFARDTSGALGFTRKKTEWWWKLREALDPNLGDDLAIPPDRQLLNDLTAPRYTYKTNGLQVEDKEDLIERIGRSPDRGDSLVLAFARPSEPIITRLL